MLVVGICTGNKYVQRQLIKFLATMSRVNSFSTWEAICAGDTKSRLKRSQWQSVSVQTGNRRLKTEK